MNEIGAHLAGLTSGPPSRSQVLDVIRKIESDEDRDTLYRFNGAFSHMEDELQKRDEGAYNLPRRLSQLEENQLRQSIKDDCC